MIRCFLIILMLCALGVKAQPVYTVSAVSKAQAITVEEGLEVLSDCKGNLSFSEVTSQSNDSMWQHDTTRYGQNCSYWLRVKLFVPDSLEGTYLLQEPFNGNIKYYYAPNSKGQYFAQKNGEKALPEERAFNYPNFNQAPVFLYGGDTTTLYVHLVAPMMRYGNSPKLYIQPFSQSLQEQYEAEYRWILIAIVSLLVLACYNLGVYFYARDHSYLLYTLVFALQAVFIPSLHSYYLRWTPDLGIHVYYLLTSVGLFAGVIYFYFSLSYLQGKQLLPRLYRKVKTFIHICATIITIGCLSAIYLGENVSLLITHSTNAFLIIGFLIILFWVVRLAFLGERTARYYLYAFSVLLSFILIYFLQGSDAIYTGFLGLIPSTPFTRASINIGLVFHALAFSLALGARIHWMRNEIAQQKTEKERLEREKLLEVQKVIEQQKEALELEVKERTLSLQEANEELKLSGEHLNRLNTTKDRLFAVISHDLRGPITSFQGISQVLSHQISKKNTVQIDAIMGQIDKSATKLNMLLDNLLKWAQMQLGGISYNPQHLPLSLLIRDIQELYTYMAKAKGVSVTIDIQPQELAIWADQPSVSTILRNIWGNALKFTENGKLLCKAWEDEGKVHILLEDTGTGMPEKRLRSILAKEELQSTKGTQGEKGNGLGLFLCKEFVQQNNGDMWLESELGIGTKVHIYLPLSAKGAL